MLPAPSFHRAIETALAVLVLLGAMGSSVCAYDARIAWSPVAGSSGYKLYVRENGGSFGGGTDVGARTPDGDGRIRFVLSGMNARATTSFAVTSYDGDGTESVRSNELSVPYATAAAVVDSDDDGLTDAAEDRNLSMAVDAGETNPLVADSDGDGVSDGIEVAQGSNPLDPNDRTPPLPSPTPTTTPTVTRTSTPLPTATRTATALPTTTRTATALPTTTRTSTPVPTATRTATPVPTTTATATSTATKTATPVPTRTSTPIPSATRTATPVPTGTATAPPTATRTATALPTATGTPVPTATVTRTATPVATATVTRTATPVPSATPTEVPTPADGDLTQLGSIIARVPVATGLGNEDIEVIRDGDVPPVGTNEARRQYDTNDGRNGADEDWMGYAFAGTQTFARVRFQEGMHFARGGWFSTLTVHVRRNGVWSAVASLAVAPPYPGFNDGLSFETYEITFAPITGDAIRIWGRPGGSDDFISVGELRVYGRGTTPDPIPTATVVPPTATPAPTRTATPAATATEQVAPTARPTAQPTIAATATPTIVPTAAPTIDATVVPTTVSTPAPSLCGNDVRDPGEQCDGGDANGCPATCLADCTCAASFTFPLEGWTSQKGPRAAIVGDPREGAARLLVVDTGQSAAGALAYPERATLDLPFPMLSFTARMEDGARLQVGVRAADGRSYLLSYAAEDGVPLASKRQSTFPLGGASSDLRTTLRDLRSDVQAAFNVELAAVTQVILRGAMQVAEIVVAAPGVLPVEPSPAAEIALPTEGWSQQGSGTVIENEYDAQLAAPTIRTEPRDPKRAKIAVSFPRKDALAAAYRTFSLVVRDEQKLAIEVRVRARKGIARLRYEAGLDAPVTKGRKTTLPLVAVPVDGSAYRLITIDLAGDLAHVVPGATLDGVLGIRVQGKFQIGDVILREPLAGR